MAPIFKPLSLDPESRYRIYIVSDEDSHPHKCISCHLELSFSIPVQSPLPPVTTTICRDPDPDALLLDPEPTYLHLDLEDNHPHDCIYCYLELSFSKPVQISPSPVTTLSSPRHPPLAAVPDDNFGILLFSNFLIVSSYLVYFSL
jgi:hypothetical protein